MDTSNILKKNFDLQIPKAKVEQLEISLLKEGDKIGCLIMQENGCILYI